MNFRIQITQILNKKSTEILFINLELRNTLFSDQLNHQMRKSSVQDAQVRQYPSSAFKRGRLNSRDYNSEQIELKQIEKSASIEQLKKSHSHKLVSDHSLQEGRQEDEQSNESQHDEIQKQADDIVNEMRAHQALNKANNKMVVGGGFSFDITEFFKFQKKKKLDSKEGDLFAQITGSVLAWIILLYSVVNAAMIPSWIMNIKATKLLRISWRFLMQTMMIFPFVLYERRVGNEEVKYQYTFRHIINPVHLKKVYISSISTAVWFTCILTVFEWTYVSHGIVLGSLSNFFLSIHRSLTKSEHDLEPGGRYCVILGICLVIYDSYRLTPDMFQQKDYYVINPFFLSRQWWQRILADLMALTVSFFMSKFSRYTSDMKSHYPPYLSMLLVNFFMCINMAFSTYFFNGLTFDTDPRFGWFSIFSQEHFAGFMYMSIVLCFGMFVSFVLISKLFSDPILPALAMTLQPVVATILLQWAGIQNMPQSYSFIGYLFIVPGLLLILVGQCLYQRTKVQTNEEQQRLRRIQIIKGIKEMKLMKSIDDKKMKLMKVKTIRNDMVSERITQSQSPVHARFKNSSIMKPLVEKQRESETNSKTGQIVERQNSTKKL